MMHFLYFHVSSKNYHVENVKILYENKLEIVCNFALNFETLYCWALNCDVIPFLRGAPNRFLLLAILMELLHIFEKKSV